MKLNKAKHNRPQKARAGQPTLRFGCLCWRRYALKTNTRQSTKPWKGNTNLND